MLIEIKHRYSGKTLFSHEQENNSFRITVELAIKSSANLEGANLEGAYLARANLARANLEGAYLDGANLLCYGDMKFIFTLQFDSWPIGFTKDILQIGCKRHPIDDWRNFSDEQIKPMASNALAWWQRWKTPLFAIIDERLKDLT